MREIDARPPDDAGPHKPSELFPFASVSISNHMADPVNLLVFRDIRERAPTDTLRRELCERLEQITPGFNSDEAMDALIRAGELECGLEDCHWPGGRRVCALTDALAGLLLGCMPRSDLKGLVRQLSEMSLPEAVEVSPPEGFAYYALHPRDFADEASKSDSSRSYAIIGIRSIGTVLSAVWLAALCQRGIDASRTTVRPSGHPYDRVTEFNVEQIRWIGQQRVMGSRFVVIDEGPGLSGSSFLSVGEALLKHGVPAERITFWGTRALEPQRLCSPGAATRSLPFHWKCVKAHYYTRMNYGTWLGGGNWRAYLLQDGSDWPACWAQMERLKFFSGDRKHVLKFDGLGRFGDRARQRAKCVADAGFGPPVQDAGNGITAYDFVVARPLIKAQISNDLIELMARYCAYRYSEFRTNSSAPSDLEGMVRFNISQELGFELDIPSDAFQSKAPVICDGRMQPYEWIANADRVFKVDACGHGDDHFFPGPSDIAWDLAGAIVEWDMDNSAAELLLSFYTRQTGHDAKKRVGAFLVAYGAFRLAYCKMAGAATQGTDEEARLCRAYEYYWQRLAQDLVRAGYLPRMPAKRGPKIAALCRSSS
jgi:hypothetical protein